MRLEAFAGGWEVARSIEDRRAGARGRFLGQARFIPAGQGLDYAETGEMTLGTAAPVSAMRSYLWRDRGGAIEVSFADGRLFHRFRSDETAPGASHDCPPDLYRVRYDFAGWPCWRAEWRVRGPRKDYRSLTTYRPSGQVGGNAA